MAHDTFSYSLAISKIQIAQAMQPIEKRYEQLKKQMTLESNLKQLRQEKIINIRNFLSQINTAHSLWSDEAIEKFLAHAAAQSSVGNIQNYLEQIAKNASLFKIDPKTGVSSRTTSNTHDMIVALGKMYSLYNMAASKKNFSVDANSFETELKRLHTQLQRGGLVPTTGQPEGLKEIGNLMGGIGAIAGGIVSSNVIENLMGDAIPSNLRVNVQNTGDKKTQGPNSQTITTDTLIAMYQVNQHSASLVATLKVSDKFNTQYRTNSTSTVRPIKLATRTVNSFLREVDPKYRNNYEVALMNYLSYHETIHNGHFLRESLLKQGKYWDPEIGKTKWLALRKAIGAEMLYSELFGIGKGTFVLPDGNVIQDTIDLYCYGDKIFFADDIIRSKYSAKKGEYKDFNAVQISLKKQESLLKSATNIQSQPIDSIKYARNADAAMDQVAYILSTSTISYSQVVKFS